MPVFPDVASRMILPGPSRPLASRSSISARATRSLTEPVGFAASSFAKRRTSGLGASRGISTAGVSPMDSRIPEYRLPARVATGAVTSASRDRGEQPDLVPLLDRRLEAREVAHVLAVEVDVHEAVELAVGGEQLLGKARVSIDELLHGVADRLAPNLDRLLAVGL